MEAESNTCPSCGQLLTGRFCSGCGRDSHVSGNRMKDFWSYLQSAYLSLDADWVRTVRDLINRPSRVLDAWIGKWQPAYLHPLRFVVIMSGLNLLSAQFAEYSLVSPQDTSQIAAIMSVWIKKKFALVWVLLIPFMACAPYLVYRRSHPGFHIHLISLAYLTGFNNLINIPLNLLTAVIPATITLRESLGFLLPFVYGIWFFRSVYLKSWLFSLGAILLSYIFGMIGFMLLYVVIYLILTALV